MLWVHDTGLAYSTDTPLPPLTPAPGACDLVDNQQGLNDVARIWKVYAAFPPESSPRLKGVGWGMSIPAQDGGYVSISAAGCGLPDADGPGTDFAVVQDGWPDTDGGMIGQSFPTGPRLTTTVELYYFSGYALGGPDGAPQTFAAIPHAGIANRFFLDDASPQNADHIMGYGSLGFGQAGVTPCPTDNPVAACCAPLGDCAIATEEACAAPRSWHPEWLTCGPNPCPLPTGACCHPGGVCAVLTESECLKSDGIYGSDFTDCLPNPCVVLGACCAPQGSCVVTTQTACVAPSVWSAAWPVCAPNPCPAPPRGSILAWGDNAAGQCNVPEPNTGFTAVAAGSWHSLGLTAGGEVVAWGDNSAGQCDVPSPHPGFIAIAAGGRHSLALTSDGAVVAWGDNSFGQCAVPDPDTGFSAIAAGDTHSLALQAGGRIVAWGTNSFGQCDVPAPNSGFTAIAAGWGHSLGLRGDGSIAAWGDTASGQCQVPPPNAGFSAVASGYLHSLGLKADGSVVAWGYNDLGQCDVPAPNNGFTAIAGGTLHSLALHADGAPAAWGDDGLGQCNTPVLHPPFAAIAAGGYHNLGLVGASVGACCHPDAVCVLVLESDCVAPDSWVGEEIPCIPSPCAPTPVLLESWTATSLAGGLRIRWEVPDSPNAARYRAWRDPAADPSAPVPSPEAEMVSATWALASADGIVETLDPAAPPGVAVRYFLERAGSAATFLGPIEVRWDPPEGDPLAAPTPFRDRVLLSPPGAGPARAELFDASGRLVRTLARPAGDTPLEWDGRGDDGRGLPAGVYLVRLIGPADETATRVVKTQ